MFKFLNDELIEIIHLIITFSSLFGIILLMFFSKNKPTSKKLIFKKSEVMAKVINRKIRFLRWLNSGIILPLSAMAIISTFVFYLVLLIVIK